MDSLFIKLVNLSINAGWLILAVLLLRLPLRKAPKWMSCLLWGLVGLRLLLPFSPESVLSLVPSAHTIPETILLEPAPAIDSGITAFDQTVNGAIAASLPPNTAESVNSLQIITRLAAVIWLIGLVGMLLYMAGSYWRLHRRVRTATLLRDNIRRSEFVDSPFILGIFRPQIYIPYGLDGEELTHVLAHENAHLARRDYLIKPLAFLILSVYWFHPLIWVAYIFLCRDIELACDERVIRNMDASQKKSYSRTLLACSVSRRSLSACPLAFGEADVRERVLRVKHYKTPALWVLLAAICACAAVAVCFLTNPKEKFVYTHSTAPALFAWRTEYIGNNSAVGNILGNLTFPKDVSYENFSLQTETEPYGVKVTLTASQETLERYSLQKNEDLAPFRENACILFALIENAGTVNFELCEKSADDAPAACTMEFTREWAESVTGANLWAESGTPEQLDALLTEISEHVIHAYTAAEAIVPTTLEDAVPTAPEDTVPTALEDAISLAIIEKNRSPQTQFADFVCCSFVTLDLDSQSSVPEKRNTAVTVYGWALYEEYRVSETEIQNLGGSHIPIVLTFDVNEDGYMLKAYQEPRDSGSLYVKDVRNLFPESIAADALDSQKYVLLQKQNCYAQVIENSPFDTDAAIDSLLQTICASPRSASNPQEYIDAHSIEYRELTHYGDYAVNYCFRRFEEGDENGLEGQIMAILCEELLNIKDKIPADAAEASTGQEWYEALKAHAGSTVEQFMQKDFP